MSADDLQAELLDHAHGRTPPAVLALDLSLTGSGIALPDGTTDTIRTRSLTGAPRLAHVRWAIIAHLEGWQPALVAIEGYAFGRTNKAHHIGELGGVIRLMLHERGQAWTEVPPASVKKYATGKGNANKNDMLAASIRQLGYEGSSGDEADALWLRAMALDHLGHPVVEVPVSHREALAKVSWPELGTVS